MSLFFLLSLHILLVVYPDVAALVFNSPHVTALIVRARHVTVFVDLCARCLLSTSNCLSAPSVCPLVELVSLAFYT